MIAFCHIYKTAGTTFTTLLRNHYGWRHFDRPGFRHRILIAKHLKAIKKVYPFLGSIGGHSVRPYSDLSIADPSIRYYTFLRDPVERSISHFTWYLRWKANDGVLFDDFPDLLKRWADADVNQNVQCRHLSTDANFHSVKELHAQHPIYFLQVTDFDTSLILFREWANLPDMNLSYTMKNTIHDHNERIQVTHPDYLQKIRAFQTRLKQESYFKDLLSVANREDQALCDWVKNEVWPIQVANYSGNLRKDVNAFQEGKIVDELDKPEPLWPRLYRNTVFKTLKPLLLPTTEPEDAQASPWL